jgi:hypothetical protein
MSIMNIPIVEENDDLFVCDKVCQCLVVGRLFSPRSLVSTTNKN